MNRKVYIGIFILMMCCIVYGITTNMSRSSVIREFPWNNGFENQNELSEWTLSKNFKQVKATTYMDSAYLQFKGTNTVEDGEMISPVFSLADLHHPVLSFMKYDSENQEQTLEIYTTTNGSDWTKVDKIDVIEVYNGYLEKNYNLFHLNLPKDAIQFKVKIHSPYDMIFNFDRFRIHDNFIDQYPYFCSFNNEDLLGWSWDENVLVGSGFHCNLPYVVYDGQGGVTSPELNLNSLKTPTLKFKYYKSDGAHLSSAEVYTSVDGKNFTLIDILTSRNTAQQNYSKVLSKDVKYVRIISVVKNKATMYISPVAITDASIYKFPQEFVVKGPLQPYFEATEDFPYDRTNNQIGSGSSSSDASNGPLEVITLPLDMSAMTQPQLNLRFYLGQSTYTAKMTVYTTTDGTNYTFLKESTYKGANDTHTLLANIDKAVTRVKVVFESPSESLYWWKLYGLRIQEAKAEINELPCALLTDPNYSDFTGEAYLSKNATSKTVGFKGCMVTPKLNCFKDQGGMLSFVASYSSGSTELAVSMSTDGINFTEKQSVFIENGVDKRYNMYIPKGTQYIKFESAWGKDQWGKNIIFKSMLLQAIPVINTFPFIENVEGDINSRWIAESFYISEVSSIKCVAFNPGGKLTSYCLDMSKLSDPMLSFMIKGNLLLQTSTDGNKFTLLKGYSNDNYSLEKQTVKLGRDIKYIRFVNNTQNAPCIGQIEIKDSPSVPEGSYAQGFENNDFFTQWIIAGGTAVLSTESPISGSQSLKCNNCKLYSPVFNIKTLQSPELTFAMKTNTGTENKIYVNVSEDGLQFKCIDTLYIQNNSKTNHYISPIPQNTKQVLLQVSAAMTLDDFEIRESTGMMQIPMSENFETENYLPGWSKTGSLSISNSKLYAGTVVSKLKSPKFSLAGINDPILKFNWKEESSVWNTHYIVIESSLNGIDFQRIDSIAGQGSTVQTYVRKLKQQDAYIRLKLCGVSIEKFSISESEKITYPHHKEFKLSSDIYPWNLKEGNITTTNITVGKGGLYSPSFDFSTLNAPEIEVLFRDAFKLMTSTDGVQFDSIAAYNGYSGYNTSSKYYKISIPLPKNVVNVKLVPLSSSFTICKASVKEGDSFTELPYIFTFNTSDTMWDFIGFNFWSENELMSHGSSANNSLVSPTIDLQAFTNPSVTITTKAYGYMPEISAGILGSTDGIRFDKIDNMIMANKDMSESVFVSKTIKVDKGVTKIKLEYNNTAQVAMTVRSIGFGEYPVGSFSVPCRIVPGETSGVNWLTSEVTKYTLNSENKATAVVGKNETFVTPHIENTTGEQIKMDLSISLGAGKYEKTTIQIEGSSNDGAEWTNLEKIILSGSGFTSVVLPGNITKIRFTNTTEYTLSVNEILLKNWSASTISEFPYFESFENGDTPWLPSGGCSILKIPFGYCEGDYSAKFLTGSTLTSPTFDLSLLEEPALVLYTTASDNYQIEVQASVDGVNYQPIDTVTTSRNNTNTITLGLDKNIKKLKFVNLSYMRDSESYYCYIDAIRLVSRQSLSNKAPGLIDTDKCFIGTHKFITWEKTGNKFSLKAVAQAGLKDALAKMVLPALDYPNYISSRKIQLTVTNLNSNVKLSVGGTEIKTNGVVTVTIDKNKELLIIATSNVDDATSLPIVEIDNLLATGPSSALRKDISFFYDIDGDGVKEYYAYAIEGENFKLFENRFIQTSICLTNSVSVSYPYEWYNTSVVPRDIDGDGMLDYVLSADNGDCLILSENGNYRIIPGVGGRICDFNNDGRFDLYKNQSRLFQQCYDGSFIPSPITTLTMEEFKVDSTLYQGWKSTGGMSLVVTNGIPSLRDNMFIGGGSEGSFVGFTNEVGEIDINRDGLTDLIDDKNSCTLVNLGKGRYVKQPLGGNIAIRDLNGDFISDYVIYNPKTKTVSTSVYNGNGKFTDEVLITNMVLDRQIYCYDFDHDGDVDILLPFSNTIDGSYAFVAVAENDGNGNFKTVPLHENVYNKKWEFIGCADIDGDGFYDMLAREKVGENWNDIPGKVWLLKGDGKFRFAEPVAPISEELLVGSMNLLQDFDNDGKYELLYEQINEYGQSTKNNYLFEFADVKANTSPERMPKPNVIYDAAAELIKINWARGNDKESSNMDLTYALRIGTAPGKGDILNADANADGSRRNFKDGNMNYHLDKIMNVSAWKNGDYYIAIQSIDPMHKGGKWSEELVFTLDRMHSGFSVSSNKLATSDTLTVVLNSPAEEGVTYHWELGDAKVLEQKADNSFLKIYWETPGERSVSLYTTDDQGNNSEKNSVSIEVIASRFDYTTNLLGGFFDLDGDGDLDMTSSVFGLMTNDGKGHMTKIPLLFNLDLKFGTPYFFDQDGNGWLDVLNVSKSEKKLWLNSGNSNLNFVASGESFASMPVLNVDINNDGKLDAIGAYEYENRLYINKGDYKTWDNGNSGFLADVNRDGLWDIIRNTITSSSPYITTYINKGNNVFETKQTVSPVKGTESWWNYTVSCAEDFDNDGYVDLVMEKNNKTFTILIGSAEGYLTTKDIYLPVAYSGGNKVVMIKDIDNNGYMDLVLDRMIIYFYADFKYNCMPIGVSNFYINNTSKFADANGDGAPDFIGNYDYNEYNMTEYNDVYLNSTRVKNSAPEKPVNVRAIQNEKGLLIQWDDAKDAETPITQMRYNVSVKKKGATGAGSFIISPMNGLKAEAAILPHFNYMRAAQMMIPVTALPVGEYEVQVQAIDAWNATSPFSENIVVNMELKPAIEQLTSACVGQVAEFKYVGNVSPGAEIVFNWDGGIVLEVKDLKYAVQWDTPGVKQIVVTIDGKSSTQSVLVHSPAEATFEVPPFTMGGAPVTFTLPEIVNNPDMKITWSIKTPRSNQYVEYDGVYRRGSSREAKFTLFEKGVYSLRMNIANDYCSNTTYAQSIEVVGVLPTPKINMITFDPETGKNRITWNVADFKFEGSQIPDYVTGINIYKEGNRYNQYDLIGTAGINDGSFVDLLSNPQITPSTYCIAINTNLGAESKKSVAHTGIHLYINKGMGNAWNLVWTPYGGAVVDNFRILRGTSPDNMQEIAQLSGRYTSYSDLSAPDGLCYYALQYDEVYETDWNVMKTRSVMQSVIGSSNVVSAANASSITFANRINILSMEKEMKLNPEQKQLHLYAEILPVTAAYKNVNWSVVSGDDIAYISSTGLLTATGKKNGQVKIRATAIDGSGIYVEREIPVSEFTGSNVDMVTDTRNAGKLKLYPTPTTDLLYIQDIPASKEGATLYIFDMDGKVVRSEHTNDVKLTISCGNLTDGIYGIKAVTTTEIKTGLFIKK